MNEKVPQDILDQIASIEGCEGILFTGSRQQGTATKESDWDFYVLLEDNNKSFRKTWVHEGIFIEVFCNTLDSINTNELVTTKISNPALRMLATGDIVLDKSGRLKEIQERARLMYEAGPPVLTDEDRGHIGYMLRNIIDDLNSLNELGVLGYYLQNTALVTAVESFYKFERKWMAKPRQIEDDIQQIDQEWADLFFRANTTTRKEKGEAIIELIASLATKYKIPLTGEVYQVRK